jgi:phage-related protein (TIGR01555 family)
MYDAYKQVQAENTRGKIRQDNWVNQITGNNIYGRDKQAGFFFEPNPYFTAYLLDQMYRSDPITQKIIEIYPREALRKGFDILGDDNKIIESVMEDLNFSAKLFQAAMWARLYGGAAIFLGIADGRASDEPVDWNNIQRIDYMHVYDRFQAVSSTGTYEFDISSPNYGNPIIYNISDPMTGVIYRVHNERILRVNGITNPPRMRLINNSWGESILTACYTYIRNYCGSLNNIATIFNDMVKSVLKCPNLRAIMASDLSSLQARVSNMAISSSNNNILVIDADEEYERDAVKLTGYPEMFDRIALGLSAVVQIPSGMLFGIEPNGLNASGDYSTRNMYDSISAYQKAVLEPPIKQFAKYVMAAKEYNFGAEPKQWSVQFTPLEQMSELESAKIRRDMAESDKIYLEMGVLTPSEVALSRFGGDEYSMETVIDKDLHADDRFQNEIAAEVAFDNQPEMETTGDDR